MHAEAGLLPPPATHAPIYSLDSAREEITLCATFSPSTAAETIPPAVHVGGKGGRGGGRGEEGGGRRKEGGGRMGEENEVKKQGRGRDGGE
jgi:hypothetical protein